jgi:hypothetical protein
MNKQRLHSSTRMMDLSMRCWSPVLVVANTTMTTSSQSQVLDTTIEENVGELNRWMVFEAFTIERKNQLIHHNNER